MAKTPHIYHHIVPQCYLKHFAIKGAGKGVFVYTFDKIQNRSYIQSIDKIAGIDDFYTISKDFNNGADNKVIEKEYLSRNVEKEYSDLLGLTIEAINSGKKLSDEIRNGLATHIAIQFLRTKEIREKDEKSLNDIMPKAIRLFQQGLALEKNDPAIAELNISYKYDPAMYHFSSCFGNEELITFFAEQLASNYWNFYYSSEPVYYTSHFPIIVNPHVPNEKPLCLGLTQYGAELSFPLSPNIMLVIWDKEYFNEKAQSDGNIIYATDKDIRYFNWLRYLYAEQVYSYTDDFHTLEIIYELTGKHEFFKYQ